MPSYIAAVMRAELYSYMAWMRNNRGYAFMMLFWPYIIAFFLIGYGSLVGNIETYAEKMGVASPLIYILASSSIMVSSIGIVDNVAGIMLHHRWIGTLPYVAVSPPRFTVYALFAAIPVSLLMGFVSLTSILPAALLIEGPVAAYKLMIVLCFVYLAMLPLVGLAAAAGGAALIVREEANIVSFLTPFVIFVSGIFYPQAILPWVLRAVSRAFPLVYVVEATRLLALYAQPPYDKLLPLAGAIAAMTIIYNGVAYPAVSYVEKQLRRSGAYEE